MEERRLGRREDVAGVAAPAGSGGAWRSAAKSGHGGVEDLCVFANED